MKQFLINLWNAQKNAKAVEFWRSGCRAMETQNDRLQDLISRTHIWQNRDSKGRFKGKVI